MPLSKGENLSFDIIIPTYRPDEKFAELLNSLTLQLRRADNIFIVNTGKEYWNDALYGRFPHIKVKHIEKGEFDHGGTRRAAANLSSADVLVFMTQDAVPFDLNMTKNLLRPIEEGYAEISYGRQLPKSGDDPIERFTRNFNYPDVSRIKSRDDLEELGIKTFFSTNVCCAYLRSVYDALGGFPRRTILNEDSILAARAINAGYRISYTADAAVIHSHSYSGLKQFRRNFDIGVSHAMFPEIFSSCKAEGEGKRLVGATASYLIRQKKPLLILRLMSLSGWKLFGYSLGKRYRRLPASVIKRCTANPEFWKRTQGDEKNV